jgi:hypothetical protein
LRRCIFALVAVIPPIGVAFGTTQVDLLVGITGAYAGLGIMFFFPAILVLFARRMAIQQIGPNANKENFLASPFTHVFWIYGIFIWCVLALAGTIYRSIASSLSSSGHPSNKTFIH